MRWPLAAIGVVCAGLALGAGAGWLVHHHADSDASAGGRTRAVTHHHTRGGKPHTARSAADQLAQTQAALAAKTKQVQELEAQLRASHAQLVRASRRLRALTCPFLTINGDNGDGDCPGSSAVFPAGSDAWLREWEQVLGLLNRS